MASIASAAIILLWAASPLLLGLWSAVFFRLKLISEEDIIRLLAARAFGLFCLLAWASTCAATLFLMWGSQHNWPACGSTSEMNSCDSGAIVLVYGAPLVTFFVGFWLWVWATHHVLDELDRHVPIPQMTLHLRKVALGWSIAFWILAAYVALHP